MSAYKVVVWLSLIHLYVTLQESVRTIKSNDDSLDYNNYSAINFAVIKYSLQQEVKIAHKCHFSITGVQNKTEISCLNNSGIVFLKVTVIVIANIIFHKCGVSFTSNKEKEDLFGAVILVNCMAVNITNSSIAESKYTGLTVMHDNNESNFDSDCSGGELIKQFGTIHSQIKPEMLIKNTNFSNNGINSPSWYPNSGGGLAIFQFNNSILTNFSMIDCAFITNKAFYGGGIQFLLNTSKVNLLINRSLFLQNEAEHGGGGIYIKAVKINASNFLTVTNSTFKDNIAQYGGGVALSFNNKSIHFSQCIWMNNTAHYGSALNISPSKPDSISLSIPPKVVFSANSFTDHQNEDYNFSSTTYRKGFGVIMVTGFKILFDGEILFENNNGSCVYAIGSDLLFVQHTVINFLNNYAEDGAGIALLGLSTITADRNTRFKFYNNTAERFGSAIFYHSIDKQSYVDSQNIIFRPLIQGNNNITFHLLGNKAPKSPEYPERNRTDQYMYVSSNPVCGNNCNQTNTECILHGAELLGCSLSKDAVNKTQFDINDTVSAIPGKKIKICSKNCLTPFRVSITGDQIDIPTAYKFVQKNIKFRGQPGSGGQVTLHGQNYQDIHVRFKVKLLPCPPFYHLSDSDSQQCSCYNNDELYYTKAHKCDKSVKGYNSRINIGYWVGYDNVSDFSNRILLLAYCPSGYCKRNSSSYIQIPENALDQTYGLDQVICNDRMGMLCGECIPNMTVHFHSHSFRCKPQNNCRYGPLLFIVAEIVPITAIFLLLIFIDVHLTSGGITGLIFFAQIYETLYAKTRGFSGYNIPDKYTLYHLIYQSINFDFLETDDLSFCLNKNIKTLDILILKYLVSAYGLALVMLTVFLVKCCSRFKCCKINSRKLSIMQALSTFIVIVYSKCASISFKILQYEALYHEKERKLTVVALQGNFEYFGNRHLPYALLAIFVILIFVLPMPLALIAYPLCNHIFLKLNLGDKVLVKTFIHKISFYKLLPLLDCFQGTFKENYRFFSGLFFLYRIILLLTLSSSKEITITYLMILLQLILVLLIHALAWPYKHKIHNVIDALLFANLAIISCLQLLKFSTVDISLTQIKAVYWIEITLANIPIVCVVTYILYKIIRKLRNIINHKKNTDQTEITDVIFLADDVREEQIDDYHRI